MDGTFSKHSEDSGSYYHSAQSTGIGSLWIQIKFNAPVKIIKLSYTTRINPDWDETNLRLIGSNDGENFTNIQDFDISIGAQTVVIPISSNELYQYYRITNRTDNGMYLIIDELEFEYTYGINPNDISTIYGFNKSLSIPVENGLIFFDRFEEPSMCDYFGRKYDVNTLSGDAGVTFNGIKCTYTTNTSASTKKYILIKDKTNFPTGRQVWSFSIWINCNTPTNTYRHTRFFQLGDFGTRNALEIIRLDNRFQLGPYDVSNDLGYGSMTKDKWYNVIETYNGSQMKFYINGNLIRTLNQTLNLKYTLFYPMQIGANTESSSSNPTTNVAICGGIANYRIYNRVLTDDEIQTLAHELTPKYTITVSDQSFNFYQKNETKTITYSTIGDNIQFEIIEGTLPSSITFNTSTGQFTGKGLTDNDHAYNLKVRIYGYNIDEKEINVIINTYKTARINFNNQSHTFITESSETFTLSKTADETVTFAIESGTLPAGVTFNTSTGKFTSNGTQISSESKSVVVRATSPNNSVGVTATITLNVELNTITMNDQSFTFYSLQGQTSKTLKYSSEKSITPVYSIINGSLPTGVTFNTSTGVFTCNGNQNSDSSTTLTIGITSSSGCSIGDSATITLIINTSDAIEKSIFIFIGVDCGVDIEFDNGYLHGYATNDGDDPGTHEDLENENSDTFFGYNHHACWIGTDLNNLEEWNWDNNDYYELPFNANNIESIELLDSWRSLQQSDDNLYEGDSCFISLNDNVISIIDDESGSSEYKFKVNFN